MVIRRWIPAVLALAMAFAPVALDVCQATCALHATESAASADAHHHHASSDRSESATGSEHSCHHAVAAASNDTGPHVTGIPHACDHSEEVTVIGGGPGKILVQAPVIVATAIEPLADGVASRATPLRLRAPVCDSIPINLPLRV